MKKTLCFVLGAMLVAMLPGYNAKAQSKVVSLTVRTLDNVTLDTAWIFSGQPGVDYFIDSAHLSTSYTGTAVWIDSAQYKQGLIIDESGYGVTGEITNAVPYATSAIVIRDEAGNYYVVGNASQNERMNGVFHVASLFSGVDTLNNNGVPITVNTSMIMPVTPAVIDNNMIGYTSLTTAAGNPAASTITFVADTVEQATAITFNRDINVNQAGKVLRITSGNSINFSAPATVVWDAAEGTIISTSTTDPVFRTIGIDFTLKNVDSVSAASLITVDGGSAALRNISVQGTDASAALINANSNSLVNIDTVTLNGGSRGINVNGTSIVTIDNTSAAATTINAIAYAESGSYRKYTTSVKNASPLGNTIHLCSNIAGNDTLSSGATLHLENDTIMGTLIVNHLSGNAVVKNGVVNNLTGDADNLSTMMFQDLDVIGNLRPNSHVSTINSGRYNNIVTSGATMVINGGKFNNQEADIKPFLSTKHTIIPNPDADAAQYALKVVNGYKVVWNNYDAMHNDTITVFDGNDPTGIKITPLIPNIASNVYFYGWYLDSGAWQHPWDWRNYNLTHDTTLYALYDSITDPLTQTVYHVRHNQLGLHNDTVVADSITYVGTIGASVTAHATIYLGFEPDAQSKTIAALQANDTIIDFYYSRLQFRLTWNAGLGLVDSVMPNYVVYDSLYYGDSIDYTMHTAFREGYTFTGWSGVAANPTMPYEDWTTNAQYTANEYPLTWTIASVDTNRGETTYTGTIFTDIQAKYTDDSSNIVTAHLYFANGTDTIGPDVYPVDAKVWTVFAVPQKSGYTLTNNNATLTINRAPVTVSGVKADTVKFFDGSVVATVTDSGTLSGVLGSDAVTHTVSAFFNYSAIGVGYNVIAEYQLSGEKAANYIASPSRDTLSSNGAILEQIDTGATAQSMGIEVNAKGYCSGNGAIRYNLASGSAVADQYKLTFDDASFTNIPWTNRAATDNSIDITVPAGTPAGTYTATLVFRNSTYMIESNPVVISFKVNLPETYTMPLFSDVIALVDTCECFTDIHWYHSTDGGNTWTEVVEAAGQYYYQEVGGLTGEYYVSATMNGQSVMTCPQTDVTTLLADDQVPAATVSAYPNPATDRVSLRISNSYNRMHTLRVMNIMGMTIVNTTFEGESTNIDLRGYQPGNYVVSIDGIVVRVIKK